MKHLNTFGSLMEDSLNQDFASVVGLSSYRATLEQQLGNCTNHRFTDKEFLTNLANLLNRWFTMEQSVFKDDHLWLITLLSEEFGLKLELKK